MSLVVPVATTLANTFFNNIEGKKLTQEQLDNIPHIDHTRKQKQKRDAIAAADELRLAEILTINRL